MISFPTNEYYRLYHLFVKQIVLISILSVMYSDKVFIFIKTLVFRYVTLFASDSTFNFEIVSSVFKHDDNNNIY